MKKVAYVKEVTDGKAVLSVKRECACGGKDACGVKCFSLQSDIMEITIANEINAKAGDFVEVEGKTSAILIYSAVVFILPVFTGLLLYFAAQAFTENIAFPYVVSASGFILSVIFLYFFLNNIVRGRNDFKIVKILQR